MTAVVARTPPAVVPQATRGRERRLHHLGGVFVRTEVLRRVTAQARDTALAARLVAGDEQALRDAYREHAPAVHGLACKVTLNPTLAEDVTQDVFVRLWEQPERFDPTRGSMRSFLLAMTHSRAVERVRAEDSVRRRHEAAQYQADFQPPVDDPARALVDQETSAAVRDALAQLPEAQRVPIELAYFEGMSYRQVAVALSEPEGTVKYRIRCGMQKLRSALRAEEVAP
jgi:RNA polymerase sigma-70 factor (ECF subfamily)